MPHDVDFKQIAAAVPIVDVIGMLGVSLVQKENGQLLGTCPISGMKTKDVFKVTPEINRFVCFCADCKKLPKRGGDCVELVRRVRRGTLHAAALEIEKHFGKQETPKADEPRKKGFDNEKFLADLDPEHQALTELGISPSTLRRYKAGYCARKSLHGRLAVAVCGVEGEIRFFIGLALNDEEPAIQVPNGFQLPYWWGVDHLEEGDDLYIASDIFEVLHDAENGGTNIICPLAPTGGDALTSLKALLDQKSLTLRF